MKCRSFRPRSRPLKTWPSRSGGGLLLESSRAGCTRFACTKLRTCSWTTMVAPMADNAHLTRCYEFCASHRLHSGAMSAEDNQTIYGKCNNPWGHGHNYRLEVTVAGPVSTATGMVVNIADLDRIVKAEILDPFDHKNLNLDVECFRERVPTSENLL